jgi:peptide/nickel transport system permease protein
MSIFLCALLIGFVFSLLLTFLTTLLPSPLQKIIYGLLMFLESLPDLFIIIVLQVSIVAIYQKTGVLIGNVSSAYDDRNYLVPIFVLSVLPTIQLYKITFLLMHDEKNKLYVNVARSMGLGNL